MYIIAGPFARAYESDKSVSSGRAGKTDHSRASESAAIHERADGRLGTEKQARLAEKNGE